MLYSFFSVKYLGCIKQRKGHCFIQESSADNGDENNDEIRPLHFEFHFFTVKLCRSIIYLLKPIEFLYDSS